ncbi:hypothetical protein GUITHDRAFT_153342 [Guillardia theta CCMP2712]|uniref:Uncharacterized protein n=1 Tax=Guillardia theta (strain CCMP2712) TaxID=905079 RepID=L1J3H4_GUITC|nr:hypothetical protein GUITHDRAFT_153342 [Guillardia theta CCMP2712]EKX43066.1 hypothetical protein GUITHDRAFT_153342 [Guillardia theta CCMP2712]|eukprot:XP_005830046.1 hypothetical protein GUITHDRAFT_153342 [Guillardia theta CCMP2712]
MPNATMMNENCIEKLMRRRSDGMFFSKDLLTSKVRSKDQHSPHTGSFNRSASEQHREDEHYKRLRSKSVCVLGCPHWDNGQINNRNQSLLHVNSISPAPDLQGIGTLRNSPGDSSKYRRRNSASPMFKSVVTQRRESPTAFAGKAYRRASTSFELCKGPQLDHSEKENDESNHIPSMLFSVQSCISPPPPCHSLQVIANGILPSSHPRQSSLYAVDVKHYSLAHLMPRNRTDWAALECEDVEVADRKATEIFRRIANSRSGKSFNDGSLRPGARSKGSAPEDLSVFDFDFIHIVEEKNVDV